MLGDSGAVRQVRRLAGEKRMVQDRQAELPGADAATAVANLPPGKPPHSRWHVFAVAFSLGLFGVAAFVLAKTLASVSYYELSTAIRATSAEQIALAGLFTGLSYLALTGYDALALRQLKLHVPYGTTALGSFTSYAISFTLGFPLITGGTVRYWIYSRAGLSAGKVASLTLVAGITFWLGMALVIGVALVLEAGSISEVNHLLPLVNQALGLAVLAGIGLYLAWVLPGHRHVRFQGMILELPGLNLTIGQMLVGVADLAAAAAVLYVLLPKTATLDYLTFLALYVFGCLLGIASHAPGGIGVFEATMLKSIAGPTQEALLASLLLFRIIYYLGPFILALALLGAAESVRRWNSLREAMTRGQEEE